MKLQLLNDMLVFIKVVDRKSFTGAADELDMSKSAVSKYISRLETNLGAQLLKRSTRALVLTEAGQALYDNFASIVEDLETAEHAVSFTSQNPRGMLRIASPASFSYHHLTPLLLKFMSLYPDIQVKLELGYHFYDTAETGIDVAIHIGDLPDANLRSRKITERGMRVCAAPQYFKKHGTPQKPSDLAEHNCLLYECSENGKDWLFINEGKEERIRVDGNFISNSRQLLEAAVVSGLGVAMLPGYLLTKDIKSGALVSALQAYCPRGIGIHAVYPPTRHLAPKVRVFIDFLVEHLGQESYWQAFKK